MSLAGRLSAFFLAALFVVLAATSAGVYALAQAYLYRQLDERLETALDTLEASVDVEPEGLEWEPLDRRITVGVDSGPEQVRWAVGNPSGRWIDRSANASDLTFPPENAPDVTPNNASGDATVKATTRDWRMAGRRLRLGDLLREGRGHPEDDSPDDDVEYPELTLTVGLAPGPVRATLWRLGMALAGTSIVTWMVCASLGHGLVRRALTPLSRMADAAIELDPDDPGWSLPVPGSGDELDALASAYNDLLARLRAAFDAKKRFAGEASHQLRTPLAGLIAQLDVALRRDRSAEEYRRVLGVARDEAARLRRIIEALLFLVRPATDTLPPARTAIRLAHWLPEQMPRWRAHPRGGDLQLAPTIDPDLSVLAHPELLAQILDNLVDNALKFSETGSPVRLSACREQDRVTIAVEDQGPGLSPEDQSQIFEPFYRADSARQNGRAGTGLGLAIAARIATSFEGRLDVQSEPGRGCRFALQLPAPPLKIEREGRA